MILSMGKCAMICKVPIIVHSLVVDTPNATAKNMFAVMAPMIAPLARLATEEKILVAAINN